MFLEFLDASGEYSPFEELMYYYHFSFTVYYLLAIIVLANCIKTIMNYISLKKGKVLNVSSIVIDLLVSILSGIGLWFGMSFLGVLADLAYKRSDYWGNQMWILSIVSFILFIIQLTLTLRIVRIKNKH